MDAVRVAFGATQRVSLRAVAVAEVTQHMFECHVMVAQHVSQRAVVVMYNVSMCAVVVAEVTQPSFGVGYEVGRAVEQRKPVLCIHSEAVLPSKYCRSTQLLGLLLILYETF